MEAISVSFGRRGRGICIIQITSYFLKEESFKDAYTCEIGFEGPLFTGTKQTQNKFRIDAGYRTGTLKKPAWKLMNSPYPEIEQNFLVLNMASQEILTEKITCLFQRKKGRDLYDIWFLLSAGITLDKDLLKKKLQKEKIKIDLAKIVTKQEYERDMSKLTSRVIPYEQVEKEVMKMLDMAN